MPLLVAGNFTGSTVALVALLLPGDADGTTVASGATLQLQGTNDASGKFLTLNGTGYNNAGALENLSGYNTWNSVPVTLGSNASFGADATSFTGTLTNGSNIVTGLANTVLTATTAPFNQPAVGISVAVAVLSTAENIVGQMLFLPGGGDYSVAGIPNGTTLLLTNLGGAGSVSPLTTVVSGTSVTAILPLAVGMPVVGNGIPAGTVIARALSPATSVAAARQPVTATANGPAPLTFGAITASLTGTLTDNSPDVTVSSTAQLYVGMTVAANATTTTTTASYTQPSVGANVSVSVIATAGLTAGQELFISGGGYYTIANVTNATTLSLTNLGYAGNVAAATVISSIQSVTMAFASGIPADTTITSIVGNGGHAQQRCDGFRRQRAAGCRRRHAGHRPARRRRFRRAKVRRRHRAVHEHHRQHLYRSDRCP